MMQLIQQQFFMILPSKYEVTTLTWKNRLSYYFWWEQKYFISIWLMERLSKSCGLCLNTQLQPIPVAMPVLTLRNPADSARGMAKFLGITISQSATCWSRSILMQEWMRQEQQSWRMTMSWWLADYLLMHIQGMFRTVSTICLLSFKSDRLHKIFISAGQSNEVGSYKGSIRYPQVGSNSNCRIHSGQAASDSCNSAFIYNTICSGVTRLFLYPSRDAQKWAYFINTLISKSHVVVEHILIRQQRIWK